MDESEFKRALGSWASGVSVITTWVDDKPHGLTANAFSAVSLQPPIVLICVKSGSKGQELISTAGIFCVNILSSGQRDISDRFAGRHGDTPRFDGIAYERG